MTVKNSISSAEKLIMVLKLLGCEPYSYSAKEIGQRLGINRSTVHRILNILMKEKFVIQDMITKKYKLGPGIYLIGSAYLINKNFTNEVVAVLNQVAEATKESVGYYIKDEDKIISVYEIESYQPVRLGYKPGTFYPIHCGSVGKCITAFTEPEKLEKLVRTAKLDKRTPNTITDPDLLLREYEKIREQGYAVSDEENLLGAYGIAAPVKNSKGEVFACVAVACLKTGLTQEKIENMKKHVIRGAKKISELMP
ncbi:MAG: IclR family transcriptional regulator [Firmicutes bacterium]|nr:IclR family transcriptional regulator [Bacillota bacterium]